VNDEAHSTSESLEASLHASWLPRFFAVDTIAAHMHPKPATELDTTGLRTKWKNAKAAAENAAKTLKQVDQLNKLHTEKMKDKLGPDLEAWPKSYPNYPKLAEEKKKLDTKIDAYAKAVKESGLGDAVKKPMTTALTEIKTALNGRLEAAQLMALQDTKAAMKASVKSISPIVIIQQDIAKNVAANAGKTRYQPSKVEVEFILSDDRVLKHVPADLKDGLLAQEIRDAVNFEEIMKELGALWKSVDDLEVHAAQEKFIDGMEEVFGKAMDRAAKPILNLAKVKSDRSMYKFKKVATIAIASGGALASAAGLIATPFTGGATGVLGIFGLIKSLNKLGRECIMLATPCEEAMEKVRHDVKTLTDQYENASKTAVGASETGKAVLHALVGDIFKTISRCQSNCQDVKGKVAGLEVKVHDESVQLSKLLTEQANADKELQSLHKIQRALTADENKLTTKFEDKYKETVQQIAPLPEAIQKFYERVKKANADYKTLKEAMDKLAAMEPTWAKIAEMVIPIITSAAFVAAGSVEPGVFTHAAEAVLKSVELAATSAETGEHLVEGIERMIKAHK
jgi:hypothetical protein